LQTAITTPVNKTKLTTVKQRQTSSLEEKPAGAIKSEHTHTPHTQLIDMSAEERRRMIWMIKGIFHKGKITAAHKPIVFMKRLRFLCQGKEFD
jgi:hypothetical protein